MEFYQTSTDTSLGHGKEVVRFWWPWPHFQGHYVIKTKNEPCVHSNSWINRWNLTKLAQILHWDGGKKWLDFSDLDLISKVTLALCGGYLISIADWHFFHFRWRFLDSVFQMFKTHWIGPRQANLVLIAYASSEGSGEPAHPRSLARTFAARSYKQWIKRNLQTESQIRGPSEWLGMRGWNLSWRNARRHKFAWRGSISFEKMMLNDK